MEPGPGPSEHGTRGGPEDRAGDDLRRRDEEFRQFADAMPHLLWIADPKGPIVWFNRRWYEYTGLSVERSAGWGWRRARHPGEGDVVEAFRAHVRAGHAWEETITLLGKDGTYRRFLSRAVPILDDEGRIFRWIGTDTDVEDQLQAREETEWFFTTVPDMLSVASVDGWFQRVNPAFVRVLGWTEAELESRPFLDFVHPDDRAATRAELEKLTRGTPTQGFENRYRTRSGDYRVLSWSASPRAEGRSLYATARDVTDVRRLEREREEMLALLDTVQEALPVGLLVFDAGLRCVRVNRELAAINGLPIAAHLGRPVSEWRPDLAATVEPLLRQVLETGNPVLSFELVDPSPGLRAGPVHRLVSFFPVKDFRGRPFLAGAVVVDITAQKRTEAALQRAAEFRERFLGIVAHDLRNPLAAISTSAQLLQRQQDLPERCGRMAKNVSTAAARMAKMIADLMDFTRVRLGSGMPVEREPNDLLLLAQQAVDEMEVAYPGRAIRLDAEGDLKGEWDGNRLVQVASNLVKNALDYSPPDGEVEVVLRREGGQVLLEVKNPNLDSPIPAEEQPSLFDPFRQAAPERCRQREGLGLGLYIAREIVLAHGGTIGLESTEEGTSFTVRLPVTPPAGG